MIFVGISENKQYIVLHGKTMRLTRSIKRIFPDASQHLAAHQQVLVCSWMCEGVVGTRLKPSTAKHLHADTGQDLDLEDDAGYDPEDFLGFDLPDETPISVLAPSARVSDTLNGGNVVSTEGVSNQATNLSDTAIGSMPVVDVAIGASVLAEQDVFAEPAAKRQKMTVSKIRHFSVSPCG